MSRKYLICLLLAVAMPAGAQQSTVPVNTTEGPIRGEVNGPVAIYRGIPYAAPPLGALRWKAPAPPLPRSTTLDAVAFRPVCPQIVNDRVLGSEDCLGLNIWAPKVPGTIFRPVMFFIHGGGHVEGSANDLADNGKLLNGFYLTKNRDVVVVTINYRLGVFGYLAHPALTAEDPHRSSGNYGLLDQIAALQWVSRNIRNFGGDPDNVTIFGQSSGAADVFDLVQSPLANGLFDRAIMESAPSLFQETLLSSSDPQLVTAERKGQVLASILGCDTTADAAGCLRSKSTAALVQADAPRLPRQVGPQYLPNVDGYVLPNCAEATIGTGQHNAVPLIIGVNKDDGASVIDLTKVLNEANFDRVMRDFAPGITDIGLSTVKTVFSPAKNGTWAQAAGAVAQDLVFTCPARKALSILSPFQSHLYFYDFTHALAGSPDPSAFHGEELRFVFGTLSDVATGSTPTPAEILLSAQIVTWWTNLAGAGDVNVGGIVPHWSTWEPVSDVYEILDTPVGSDTGLEKGNCAFLASLFDREVPNQPPPACRTPRRRAVRH